MVLSGEGTTGEESSEGGEGEEGSRSPSQVPVTYGELLR